MASINGCTLEFQNGLVVPNVTGKTEAEALIILKNSSIGWASTYRAHVGFEKGIVAGQIPKAGVRIDPSSKIVFLDVSHKRLFKVPNVVNHDAQQAKKLLQDKGFIVETTVKSVNLGRYHGIIECLGGSQIIPLSEGRWLENKVISTSPNAGEPAELGSKVNVTVSSNYYEMPEHDPCKGHSGNKFRFRDRLP